MAAENVEAVRRGYELWNESLRALVRSERSSP
jgi:hypothetical protein